MSLNGSEEAFMSILSKTLWDERRRILWEIERQDERSRLSDPGGKPPELAALHKRLAWLNQRIADLTLPDGATWRQARFCHSALRISCMAAGRKLKIWTSIWVLIALLVASSAYSRGLHYSDGPNPQPLH